MSGGPCGPATVDEAALRGRSDAKRALQQPGPRAGRRGEGRDHRQPVAFEPRGLRPLLVERSLTRHADERTAQRGRLHRGVVGSLGDHHVGGTE